MIYFKVLVLVTTCLSWSYGKLDKYCSICEDHTLCKYHTTGEDCEDIGESGVTNEEKREILDTHNWLRRIVATGHETRGVSGPQPKAANMMKLVWDEELSKVAQRWADQCRFQHDTCRDDPRWKVGQNIYWKWKYPVHEANWTEAITSWYGEVSSYNPNEVDSYRFDAPTGHYTQLIWHDTYAIGCGRRDYGPNKIYVCNYGPAGNWIGEPMYEVGEPCTKCPHGTSCDEYLCAFSHSNEVITTTKPEKGIIDANAITHTSMETESSTHKHFNESKHNKENSHSVHNAEHNKTKTHNQTQTKPVHKNNVLHLRLGDEENPKTTTNTIDDNSIEIDPETQSGIEDIKLRVEKLIKKVIKKLKSG